MTVWYNYVYFMKVPDRLISAEKVIAMLKNAIRWNNCVLIIWNTSWKCHRPAEPVLGSLFTIFLTEVCTKNQGFLKKRKICRKYRVIQLRTVSTAAVLFHFVSEK